MNAPAWPRLYDWVAEAAGNRPQAHRAMAGGSIAAVYRLQMTKGLDLVLKLAEAGGDLTLEGRMLRYLGERSALPVPEVLALDAERLLMTHIAAGGPLNAAAEEDAADHLAALHDIPAKAYGFDYDTVIGGIPQPNGWMEDWRDFFRERRLLYMADLCLERGLIDRAERRRFDRLAARLSDFIPAPAPPGLIHGDMWGGNVLAAEGRIAGFIDPALYYADPEIELAYSTLFSTFGERFFARYGERRPILSGFFEVRRDLYNLWHLLNHVYLFGRGYWRGIERTLTHLGC